MKTGMLWFDSNKHTTLAQKIDLAKVYYETKYRTKPTAAQVNPSMLQQTQEIGGLVVSPNETILPYHIFIGVEES